MDKYDYDDFKNQVAKLFKDRETVMKVRLEKWFTLLQKLHTEGGDEEAIRTTEQFAWAFLEREAATNLEIADDVAWDIAYKALKLLRAVILG